MATQGKILANTGGTIPALKTNSFYQLIEEKVISGAAVTSFDFDYVLNGNADGGYIIELDFNNPTASDSYYFLRLNGAEVVVAQSYYQETGASGLANSYSTGIQGGMLGLDATTAENGIAIIRIPFSKTGTGNWERFVFWETSHVSTGSSIVEVTNAAHLLTTPANSVNIVSLGIGAAVASSIGSGSVARLKKLKGF